MTASDAGNLAYEENVKKHQQKLDETMRHGGAYEEDLSELSLELGNLYLAGGEAEKAVEQFERALHVTKINHGLDSELQIPILKSLIQSYIDLGDWSNADSRQRNLYVIETEAHGSGCELVPAIEKLARWNIDLFGRSYGKYPDDYLYESVGLYEQALEIAVSDCSGNRNAVISRLASRLLGTWYIISLDEAKINIIRRIELRRKGEAIIERMIDRYSASSEAGSPYLGEAKVKLADWRLLFGKEAGTNRLYEQALAELKRSKVGEDALKAIFDPSVPIPEFFELEFRNPLSIDQYESPVAVSYRRERSGHAADIAIDEAVPADISRRMSKYLGESRFRPAISGEGHLLLTAPVAATYVSTSD